MNAKQVPPSSKSTHSTIEQPVLWSGVALAVAVVLAISVTIYGALTETASGALHQPKPMAKLAQGDFDYLFDYGGGQYTPDQIAPDIARRVARDQQRAASMTQLDPAQAAPDVARRVARDQLRAASTVQLDPAQVAPDVARRVARDQLRAEEMSMSLRVQASPDL